MLILDSIGDIPLILHNVFIRPKQVPHDIYLFASLFFMYMKISSRL